MCEDIRSVHTRGPSRQFKGRFVSLQTESCGYRISFKQQQCSRQRHMATRISSLQPMQKRRKQRSSTRAVDTFMGCRHGKLPILMRKRQMPLIIIPLAATPRHERASTELPLAAMPQHEHASTELSGRKEMPAVAVAR